MLIGGGQVGCCKKVGVTLPLAGALNSTLSPRHLDLGNSSLQKVEEGQERTIEMAEVGLLLYGEKSLVASQAGLEV